MTVGRDFSQHGEQRIIFDWLNSEKGRRCPTYCVDAGAYDGVVGSNSRALFLSGWGGLVIEPDPRTFARLRTLYSGRPDIVCRRVALSDRRRLARMHFSAGPAGTEASEEWKFAQVNTLSPSFAGEFEQNHGYRYRSSWCMVTTLTSVLKRARAPRDIGFLSIDCEGEDLKIITAFDFSRYRPRLICVESDDHNRSFYADEFAKSDYHYYAHTAGNTFFTVGSSA